LEPEAHSNELIRRQKHVNLSKPAMSNPRPAEGFVRPSLCFSCSESYPTYWQPVLILIILILIFLMQVVLSANLSLRLPLQLGFQRF